MPGRLPYSINILTCKADELPEEHVEQLVEKSRQPHILEFEGHEDVGTETEPGRFRTLEDYEKWSQGKERFLYMMIREGLDGIDIGGVIWFGRRQNINAPGRDVTFAIRNYDEDAAKGWGKFRGMGLGTPFMQATHADVASIYPGERLWLDLVDGNEPAFNLYSRNGYQELARLSDPTHGGQERIVMANDTALALGGVVTRAA